MDLMENMRPARPAIASLYQEAPAWKEEAIKTTKTRQNSGMAYRKVLTKIRQIPI
jgi:hypothetical protein